MIMLFAALDF